MVILLLPTVSEIIPVFPVIESAENREMKSFPEISYAKLDSFPQGFDDYYSDNFIVRDHLLRLNGKIKFQWFDIPPHQGKAFMGRQGWMYAVKDEMDIYLGNNIFTEDTLQRFVDILKYRNHILDSLHCKYYFVIVPIKTTIYPEYLPLSKIKSNQRTLTDQIVTEFGQYSNINLIDLRGEMIDQKGANRLYYKTDNHWNEFGGYTAYRIIMEYLNRDFPDLNPIDISEFDIVTSEVEGKMLTNLMGIIGEVSEIDISLVPKFEKEASEGEESNYPVPGYFPYKDSYERVYVTNNSEQPKLLMIHDSFGSTLIPFLSEHFSKSVFIFDGWQHAFNEEIVLNEKPDIYIQLVVESLLPNIPKNAEKP